MCTQNYFYLIAGFSIIIILASILLALYTITDNYRSLSYLDKAYGINSRIERIYSTMKDAENQQRGYLITNKSNFLRSFDNVEKDINIEYSGLHDILKNEKEQQENLITLRIEIDMKIKILYLIRY